MRFNVRRRLSRAAFVLAAASLAAGASMASASADEPDVHTDVVGGRDATESYEFMASMLHPHPSTGKVVSYCGGSLIKPDEVLTAAHCAASFLVGVTQVRVGSHNWQEGGTLANVAEIFIHPGYGDGSKPGNDVAVLRLDRKVPQQPIQISHDSGKVGDLGRVIGWGATCNYGSPQWPCYPTELHEADVRHVDDTECAAFDASVELCLKGDNGQMACFGDSGGPWVRKVHGRWELVGATRGDGDANSDTDFTCSGGTGIWTDLTKYRRWIYSAAKHKPMALAADPEPEFGLPYEPGSEPVPVGGLPGYTRPVLPAA